MRDHLYFDLTEVHLSNLSQRTQYYGIARTVHETAKEAALLNTDICFVIFSFATNNFYEISWHKSEDGSVKFNIPTEVSQTWIRSYFGGNRFLTPIFRLINFRSVRNNLSSWQAHARDLKPVSIDDGLFFSAARPKLIVDMVRSLRAKRSNAKIVPLLHDFMPLHAGATKRFRKIDRNFLIDNRFLIKEASHILTNSKFTAKELQMFADNGTLPRPRGPVTVVQLVHQCPEGTEQEEITLPSERYLLTVGLNVGRKNIEVVLEALRVLQAQRKTVPQLVIAGSRRKRVRRYASRRKFHAIQDRLIFIDDPNQTDLVRLYKAAFALVMPSKLEGWGLPAGEALWCGTPAICSTAEALHEVCGDLGIYFRPDDARCLANIIHDLMSDQSRYNHLKRMAVEARPRLRDWHTVAKDTLASLAQLEV